jgi:hypothetical protein
VSVIAALKKHQIDFPQGIGALEPPTLLRLWTKTVQGVVRYGFTIELVALDRPTTGTFDGLRIRVDPSLPLEMQCFILLHLFGHSVQWVAPSLAGILLGIQRNDDPEDFLKALHAYEQQAARLGLALLHELGITDLDQWLTDSAETDWRYVERYYREGAIPKWEECVVEGCPLMEPLPIPPLEHRKVSVRFAF